MKTKYTKLTILLAALMLILTPSCSDEEGFIPSTQNNEGTITFRIQGKKQPMSYAIATENENVVDSLEIYMFSDDSKKLQKVFRIGKTGLAQAGTDLTATIDVTGRTGKHIFYFVANGKDNASSLDNVDTGATTEDDFRERLTDIHTEFITTPLLMTTRQVIENVESPTAPEKQVKLFRRVARFDVVNNATETNFTIENIIVENVNQQGHIFGEAVGTPKPTLVTGGLPMINFGEKENANTGTRHESLFYLYPTEMGVDKSVISFVGTLMGERRIYSLNDKMDIEANKRYTLKVIKVEENEPKLSLVVEDWADDDGTHEAEPEAYTMAIGEIVLTGGAGIQVTDKTYDITDATATGTIKVPVKTFNSLGTRVQVTYLHGTGNGTDRIIVTSPEPALTYSAGYLQEHKIEIPVQKTPLHAQIEIINNYKPEERDTLYINGIPNYDTTSEKPVLFGDIYWAPVNVGATEIGTTTEVEHHGLFFQWGRNTGFVYSSTDDTQEGPVSYDEATTGDYKDKFITKDITPYDWLDLQDDNLWSGAKRRGPCPEGWRVPSKTELESIKAAYESDNNDTVIFANNRLEIKGDNPEEMLYFPAAGNKSYATGNPTGQGYAGRYWLSESDNTKGSAFYFSSSSLSVSTGYRAAAYTVRCVQD